MARAAAILILLSQAILLAFLAEPTGARAIAFSFVGHPLLGLGLLLALVALIRGRSREGEG